MVDQNEEADGGESGEGNGSCGVGSGVKPPPTQQLEGIVTPHDNDVLSGRGNFVNYHAGNEHFRALVRKNKVAYVACPKPQKGKYSRLIVDEIRSRDPPGRFLKQDNDTKLWHDIGDKKALDKTRQALREGAPELLKGLAPTDDEDEDVTLGSTNVAYPQNAMQSQAASLFGPGGGQQPGYGMMGYHGVGPTSSNYHPYGVSNPAMPPPSMTPSSNVVRSTAGGITTMPLRGGGGGGGGGGGDQSRRVIPGMTIGGAQEQQQEQEQQPAQQHPAAITLQDWIQQQEAQGVAVDQLQKRLASMGFYQIEQFEPTPINPQMNMQQQLPPQPSQQQIPDTMTSSPDTMTSCGATGARMTTTEGSLRGPAPSGPTGGGGGGRPGLERADSLTFDSIFKEDSSQKTTATSTRKDKKLDHSSAHMSAMSFSIGDMSEATNLSAVFEDPMRITMSDEPKRTYVGGGSGGGSGSTTGSDRKLSQSHHDGTKPYYASTTAPLAPPQAVTSSSVSVPAAAGGSSSKDKLSVSQGDMSMATIDSQPVSLGGSGAFGASYHRVFDDSSKTGGVCGSSVGGATADHYKS